MWLVPPGVVQFDGAGGKTKQVPSQFPPHFQLGCNSFYPLYKLDLIPGAHFRQKSKKQHLKSTSSWGSINALNWTGKPNDHIKRSRVPPASKKHVQENSQISLSLFCPLRTFPIKSWETSVCQGCQVFLNLVSSTGSEFSLLCSSALAFPMTGTSVLTPQPLGFLCRVQAHPRGGIWFT